MASSIVSFVKREAVGCIALLCAPGLHDFRPALGGLPGVHRLSGTALLFCLMAVVAGLQDCGLFAVLAQKLLAGKKRMRFISLVLVLLPFFTSMLITNDVALITFVPFTLLVLGLVGRLERALYLVVLQTLAANLGSMATPVGNPQNLYLYSAFGIPAGEFFTVMAPLTLVSLAGLSVAALCVKPEGIEVRFPERQTIRRPRQLWLMAALFLLCLLSVFHVLHYAVLLAIVAVCLLLFARHLFPRVDYGLLFTFVCFFIFAGNIGNIPAVKDFLSSVMAENTFITSLCASQNHQQRARGGAPLRLYRRLEGACCWAPTWAAWAPSSPPWPASSPSGCTSGPPAPGPCAIWVCSPWPTWRGW